jgi:gliding-associated putative ABC transporter substrate-binding component GldG/gliding motility-associated ABC transporter permease protein GldF
MWAICKKEWTHYFGSLTGYLVICFYLLVNGLFLFVLPNYNVLDFGYASLQVYFDYAPWFLLLLVPAITMRSFSDEFKQGTYEVLSSLPIKPLHLVIGKLLGVLVIISIALAPTILYALALDQLSSTGGIDWGATWGAYIGLFFLASTYAVIGIFSSSVTKHSLISLLLSIVISVLMYKGFDWISELSFFQHGYDFYVRQLGLQVHFDSMSKGVLYAKDIIYFLSLIALFVLGSLENVKGKKMSALVFFLIILVNLSSYWIQIQFDLTKDHRYTLSKTSKDILRSVQVPTKIHLYLGGNLPIQYKKMGLAAASILNKIAQENKQNIEWQIDLPNETYKDTALYQVYDSLSQLGLPIQRVQSSDSKGDQRIDQLVIPGILVEVEGKKPIAIDLRSSKKYFKPYNIVKDLPEEDVEASANAAEALLEFKIIQAIYFLHRAELPTIGYLIGNGEPVDLTVNDLGQSIRHQYDLKVFDLKKGFPQATSIKTLLIVKPTIPFSDLDKFKIDQYIMSGGNIIWAIDKLHAEYDSLQKTDGSYIAYDRNLGLDDLLFKYGVRINSNLLQDLNCSKLPVVVGKDATGNVEIQRIPWPYYPFLNGNNEHAIVKNIDRVLSQFPSSVDTIKANGITKTVLLSTDTNSRIIATPNLISLNSGKTAEELSSFVKHRIPVAILLEGKFSSLFANRVESDFNDSLLKYTHVSYRKNATAAGKQIVIADADIFTNYVDKSKGPLPMGMLPYEDYQFGNREFFTNCILYVNEPVDVLEARNKQLVLRLLNREKVAQLRVVWQLLLTLGPVFLLGLWQWAWNYSRKRQFAA